MSREAELKTRTDTSTYPATKVATTKKAAIISLALASFPMPNFMEVDKTGLETGVSQIDIFARLLWFTLAFAALLLSNRQALPRSFKKPNHLLALTLLYCATLIPGILANSANLVTLYRLLEYSLVILSLITLIDLIKNAGKEHAAHTLSLVIFISASVLLAFIAGGMFIDPSHFYGVETQGRARLGGNAYSPNLLGVIFSLAIICSIHLKKNQVKRKKYFYVIMITAFVVGLYLTGSRTAQLGLIIALVLWTSLRMNRLNRLIMIIFFSAPLIFIISILSDQVISAAASLLGKGAGVESRLEDLLTLNNRNIVAEVGLRGALENWTHGVGFVEGVKQYYRENFTQGFWVPPHSHNALIEAFLSGGIATFFLAAYVYSKNLALIAGKVAAKMTSKPDRFAITLLTPMMAASLTMTTFGGIYTPITMWFFIGTLLLWTRERENKTAFYY
ncbi:MAG: hypothetical protein CMM76_17870 [Rhodospirillaceae bacterium]|nr:hypothetical protein [Rhodospirillaceae bacterium]|tara:strand:- start:2925 stop:4268 length:1344 start_codon:yes stop_codon:yes gene_type:complete